MKNEMKLVDRFLKKNRIGKNTENIIQVSLLDILEALDDRSNFNILYYDTMYDNSPSKIYTINVGYNSLNEISVIDIKKMKGNPVFENIKIEDLEATINLDGSKLSVEDIRKLSEEMYIGHLEIIKDNLDNLEDFFEGYISTEDNSEIQSILSYLVDEGITSDIRYLEESELTRRKFVYVENVRLELHLNKDINLKELGKYDRDERINKH